MSLVVFQGVDLRVPTFRLSVSEIWMLDQCVKGLSNGLGEPGLMVYVANMAE